MYTMFTDNAIELTDDENFEKVVINECQKIFR